MRLFHRAFLLLACVFFALGGPAASSATAAEAVKLALKFREGQVLRYTYHETLTYTPPTKFVGVFGYALEVKVDYTVWVSQVSEDQVASVRFAFDRITVRKDGKQIADLTVFPKQVDSVSATIRPNGETTFHKNVYLAVNRGGQLEFRVSTGGGALATGTTSSAGSETFQLAADLDEGEGVIKIGVPPTRNVETPEHNKLVEFKVDLTPRKLFEFISLPSVPLAAGQTFSAPLKYLGRNTTTYRGQADEAGYQGALVDIAVSPWTEAAPEAGQLQPAATGSFSYLIDPGGKLVRARAKLRTEVQIPEVGTQAVDDKLELTIRK